MRCHSGNLDPTCDLRSRRTESPLQGHAFNVQNLVYEANDEDSVGDNC